MTDVLDFLRSLGPDAGGTASALEILLRVTVLLSATILVVVGLRRSSAALRHAVWTLSLAGALLIPPFFRAFPAWQWAILPQPHSSSPLIAPGAKDAPSDAPPRSLYSTDARADGPFAVAAMPPAIGGEQSPEASPALVKRAAPSAVSPAPVAAHRRWSWSVFLAVFWASGTFFGLVWLGSGTVGAWYFARRAQPAADPHWRQILRQLSAPCDFRRPIEIRECPLVSVPMTWGLRRPVILVPTGSAAWSAKTKRSVLLHELGHIRRGDFLFHLLGRLACAAYWFHPLVWLAAAQLRRTSEQAADDVVLSHNVAPSDYARHLVGIAAQTRGLRLFGHVALPMVSPSNLERRVLAILDPRRDHRSLKRKTCCALAVIAAVLLIPCALLRPGYAKDEKPRKQTTAGDSLPQSVAPTLSEKGAATAKENEPAKQRDAATAVFRIQINAVDAETGAPLAEVPVKARTFYFKTRRRRTFPYKTDSQGNVLVEIPDVSELGDVSVCARPAGYVPQYYDWEPREAPLGIPERIAMRFRKGIAIGGRIEDESGKPVAGAKVEVLMPATLSQGGLYFRVAKVKSDGDGRWRCDGAPSDLSQISVSAEHPDYICGRAGAAVEMKEFRHVIRLQRGLIVAGQVLDAKGQPVKGASAVLGLMTLGSNCPQAETDAQGRFELKRCAAGPSAVTVQAEGYAPQCERLIVAQQNKALSFRLGPAATIRGRVVDPQGKPLAGVGVFADTWQGLRNLGVRLTTDKEGCFVWKNAPRDSVLFHLWADGFMSKRDCSLVASAEEHTITLYPELAIRGTVVDHKTGKPIDRFRVYRGYGWEGRKDVHFPPENVAGRDGCYELRICEPSVGIYVKIEAEGYKPAVSREFAATEGRQSFDFKLTRGEGPSGIVLRPDGKPAQFARVLVSTLQHQPYLQNGRWHPNIAPAVEADSQGRFRLMPPEATSYHLVAVHESGLGCASPEDLDKSGSITLQPWGRLEGTVWIGDRLAGNERVTFQLAPRGGRMRPDLKMECQDLIHANYEATTDDRGHFVMDRVIPGKGSASRVVVVSFGQSSMHAPSHMTPVEILSGRTARVEIGGRGRPVVGRIDTGSRAVQWALNQPGTARSPRDPRGSYAFRVAPDGTFRIDDVLPGTYSLRLPITEPPEPSKCGPGVELGKVEGGFTVPEIPGGRTDEPLDIGTLKAVFYKILKAGDAVPASWVYTLDNNKFQFQAQKGKVVLAYFWATWCKPCRVELPDLKRIYKRFHADPNFVMIGLSLDQDEKSLAEYVKREAIPWPQARVGSNYRSGILVDFGVRNVPRSFLIGADGKIIAADLCGAKLEAAVESAISQADKPPE